MVFKGSRPLAGREGDMHWNFGSNAFAIEHVALVSDRALFKG